ncbi:MAG TPA: hypothetical protein VGO34_14945 [Alphaproteobacteria bacterium]|jgi:hypothetical protein
MPKFLNCVKETSDTTGTGPFDLNGAPQGFFPVGSQAQSGDQIYYTAVDNPDAPTMREIGYGTFTAGTPDTLSRDVVEASTNDNEKVSWPGGTLTIVATATAGSFGGAGPLDQIFAKLGDVNSFTKTQKWSKGADVTPVAGVLTLGDDGNYFVLQAGAVTSIATKGVGTTIRLQAAGVSPLTNSAGLVVPGGDYATVPGDVLEFTEYDAGQWRLTGGRAAIGGALGSARVVTDAVQATTSGATKSFTAPFANVKRITVLFNAVSLSGSDQLLVRIGPASGLATSGYVSSAEAVQGGSATSNATSTVGFVITVGGASSRSIGRMVLERFGGDTWIESHVAGIATNVDGFGGGNVTLGGDLTQLQLLSTGSNTFDGGSVNVVWETWP